MRRRPKAWIGATLALMVAAWLVRLRSLQPDGAAAIPPAPAGFPSRSIRETGASERRRAERRDRSAAAADSRQARAPRTQRAVLLSPEAMRAYSKILDPLGLPPERRRRLERLIVAREETELDAQELAKEYHLEPKDAAAAANGASTAIDSEITDCVGSSDGQIVFAMLALAPQLAAVDQSVGRDLVAVGEPLSAPQMLRLAAAYQDAWAAAPAGAIGGRTAGFDLRAGLADADRRILNQMEGVLSATQEEILRASLARTASACARAGR